VTQRLAPSRQTGGEPRRKVGVKDAILRSFQIVGRAVEMNYLRVAVEQSESRAPIAVAWLADRARIDHVARGVFQLQGNRFRLSYGAVFRTKRVGSGTVGKEAALHVGVAKERQRHTQCDQWGEGIAQRNNVFIFVNRGAVHQLNIGQIRQRDWAVRQGAKPFEIFGTKFVAGPDSGCGGHGIEIIEIDQSGHSFVVIATNENLAQRTRTVDHLVRAGTISHDVTKIDDEIVCGSSDETSVERFEIGVNIAEQKYAQADTPDKLGIIDEEQP
jgi:hypothetical protein